MENLGIIEVIFGAVGFAVFYVWQMRTLKRDRAALKARLEAEAKADQEP